MNRRYFISLSTKKQKMLNTGISMVSSDNLSNKLCISIQEDEKVAKDISNNVAISFRRRDGEIIVLDGKEVSVKDDLITVDLPRVVLDVAGTVEADVRFFGKEGVVATVQPFRFYVRRAINPLEGTGDRPESFLDKLLNKLDIIMSDYEKILRLQEGIGKELAIVKQSRREIEELRSRIEYYDALDLGLYIESTEKMKEDVEQIKRGMKSLGVSVDSLLSDLDNASNELEMFKVKLDDISRKLDDVYNKGDIDTMMTGKADKRELDRLKEELTEAEDSIAIDREILNKKADKADIPTKLSQLRNDSEFITLADIPGVDLSEVNSKLKALDSGKVDKSALSSYYDKSATNNLLNNKANKSSIPTKLSQLQNDNGFITLSDIPKVDLSGVELKIKGLQGDVRALKNSKLDKDAINSYYTKTEVNSKLGGKANANHTHEDYVEKASKNKGGGYVALDENAKIPLSLLPDISKQRTFFVDSFADIDALAPQKADRVYVLNNGDTYIYDGANWRVESKAEWENINLLWSNIKGIPKDFTPKQHIHSIADIEQLGVVLAGKANEVHSHNLGDVKGLSGELDKLASKDIVEQMYVKKEGGKGLSSNDFTNALKAKLSGIENEANKYVHPDSHSAEMIIETDSKQFASAKEKVQWSNKANSDHTHSAYANKTDIPTKISELTNDAGYIKSVAWGDITSKPSAFKPTSHNHDTLYYKKGSTTDRSVIWDSKDDRNLDESPSEVMKRISRGASLNFRRRSVVGNPPIEASASSTYVHLISIACWSDSGGGYPVQISIGGEKIGFRQGVSDTAWGDWTVVSGDDSLVHIGSKSSNTPQLWIEV